MAPLKLKKLIIHIVVGYMLLILISSLIPGFEISDSKSISNARQIIQNLLHIPIFAILSILSLQILRNLNMTKWRAASWAFVFCVLFGILNEIIQEYVPGRFGSISDIAFNSIGAIAGIIIYLAFEKRRNDII